jgi:predicted glutamine amidotransferase
MCQLLGMNCNVPTEIARHGRFNCILSNGDYVFAYCTDNLAYVLRHALFATARRSRHSRPSAGD